MNQKTKMRYTSEKGITLIALVITVIVLIILAGVTISMTLDNRGIVSKAKDAKNMTEAASGQESDDLDTTTNIIYEVAGRNIVQAITPENYGDYITGYMDLPEIKGTYKDWQVFYNDGTNVWIIASDYVLLDDETLENAGMSRSQRSDKIVFWSEPPSKYEDESAFDNGKCVLSLLDDENWGAYCNKNLAEIAIGGPTIKMFADSFNAKYQNNVKGIIEYNPIKTESNEGYELRWGNAEDKSWNSYIEYMEFQGEVNNMYSREHTLEIGGFWLAASPSKYKKSLLYAGHPGDAICGVLNESAFDDTLEEEQGGNGICPVVRLKSDVRVTNEKGTWVIQD